MIDEEKECLAQSYANAWNAVKGGKKMSVEVLPHGWYSINYGYPMGSRKVRAIRLYKGLATLTQRMANGDAYVVTHAIDKLKSFHV
jgi:hypothetical protein